MLRGAHILGEGTFVYLAVCVSLASQQLSLLEGVDHFPPGQVVGRGG